jgi:hypothetical protein
MSLSVKGEQAFIVFLFQNLWAIFAYDSPIQTYFTWQKCQKNNINILI